MNISNIIVKPIGIVKSSRKDASDDFWGNHVSTIEIDTNQFSNVSLKGLREFSHIEVVFHFHLVNQNSVLKSEGHPRGNTEWPSVGIFAQRKKDRPNCLGVSVCELIAVNGLNITVKALDAIDGTPILDIKPYVKEFFPDPDNTLQPKWASELMKDYFKD